MAAKIDISGGLTVASSLLHEIPDSTRKTFLPSEWQKVPPFFSTEGRKSFSGQGCTLAVDMHRLQRLVVFMPQRIAKAGDDAENDAATIAVRGR